MQKILIINSAPFTNEFVQPIVNTYKQNSITYELVDYDQLPDNKSSYTGIIISASPKGDDILESQRPYYEWLKDSNIPVIGSCHGHQIMAVIYGTTIHVNKEAEEGFHSVTTLKNDTLFNNLSKTFDVEQHHIKSVSLPKGFELLASSQKCKVQIMKHKQKPMYGLQFHIESNAQLLMNFATICKEYIQ